MILLAAFLSASDLLAQSRSFDAFEMTIPELQAAMARGETTSQELVRQYLERGASGARGPLHGIPIVLKDNFNTYDMPTTASVVA